VEESPSWKANSHSASQQILRILLNPKIHYRLQKGPPLDPILSQMNLIHALLTYFPMNHSYIYIFPSIPRFSKWYLPLRDTCPARLTILDLITLIIRSEEHKLWSSSLCNLLQLCGPSYHLGRNILFSTLFSNTLNLCSSPSMRNQVSHP
jgi:hypothetical protein